MGARERNIGAVQGYRSLSGEPYFVADSGTVARVRTVLAAILGILMFVLTGCPASQVNPQAAAPVQTSPIVLNTPVKVRIPDEGAFDFVQRTEVSVTGRTRAAQTIRLTGVSVSAREVVSDDAGDYLFTRVPLLASGGDYEIDTADRVGDLQDGTVDRHVPVSGSVLPGALVTLAVANTSTTRTLRADATGAFLFNDVNFNEGPNQLTLTVVSDGAQTVRVSFDFTMDTAPPVVAFTSIETGDSFSTPTVSFQGQLDERNVTIEYTDPETGVPVSFLNTSRLFNIPFFSFPEGHHAFSIRFIDSVGNITEEIVNFRIDLKNPPLVIMSPRVERDFFTSVYTATISNPLEEVTGFTEPGAQVRATLLTTGDVYVQTTGPDGRFTIPPFNDVFGQTTRYEEGIQQIRILITDAAGRTTDELLTLILEDGAHDDRQVTVVRPAVPGASPPNGLYSVIINGTTYSAFPRQVSLAVATGNNGTSYPFVLQTIPVLTGTFSLADVSGGQLITDDGLGNLVGDVSSTCAPPGGTGIIPCTINYATGAVMAVFAAAVPNGAPIVATYTQNTPISALEVVGGLAKVINDGGQILVTAANYGDDLVVTATDPGVSFSTIVSPDLTLVRTTQASFGSPPPFWVENPRSGSAYSSSGFNRSQLALGLLSPPIPLLAGSGGNAPYTAVNYALDGRRVLPPDGASRFLRCDPLLPAGPQSCLQTNDYVCLPGDPVTRYPELRTGEPLTDNVIKVIGDPTCDGFPVPVNCEVLPDGRRIRVIHIERLAPLGGCPVLTTEAHLDAADLPALWISSEAILCTDPVAANCPGGAVDLIDSITFSSDGLVDIDFNIASTTNLSAARDGFAVHQGDTLTYQVGTLLGVQSSVIREVISPTRLRVDPLVTQQITVTGGILFRIDRNLPFVVGDTLTDVNGDLSELQYGLVATPVFDTLQGEVIPVPVLRIPEVQTLSFSAGDALNSVEINPSFHIYTPTRASLEIVQPSDGTATSALQITVEGYVRGDPELPFVEINGRVTGVDPSGRFILNALPLESGTVNQIQIIAVDSGSNVVTETREVIQTGTGTVSVNVDIVREATPAVVAGNDFIISGSLSDNLDELGIVIASGIEGSDFLMNCPDNQVVVNRYLPGFSDASVQLTAGGNPSILYVVDGPSAGTHVFINTQLGVGVFDFPPGVTLCAPNARLLLLQRNLLIPDASGNPQWSITGSIASVHDRHFAHKFNFGFTNESFIEITAAGFAFDEPGAVDSDAVGVEVRVVPPFIRPFAPVRFLGADALVSAPCPAVAGIDPNCEAVLASPSNQFAVDAPGALLATGPFPQFDDTVVAPGDIVVIGSGHNTTSPNELRYYEVVGNAADPNWSAWSLANPNQIQIRSVDRNLNPDGALIASSPWVLSFAVYPHELPLACNGAPCPGGPGPGNGPAQSNQPILTQNGVITVSGFVDRPDAIVTVDGILSKSFPDGSFVVSGVPLSDGLNLLSVEATDFAGFHASHTISVHSDNTEPEFSQFCIALDTTVPLLISDPCNAALAGAPPVTVAQLPFPKNSAIASVVSQTVEIRGVLKDQNFGTGVQQVEFTINGTPATVYEGFTGLNDPFGGTGLFSHPVTLQRGANKFELRAVDRAGNVSEFLLVLNLDIPDPRPPTVTVDCLTDAIDQLNFNALSNVIQEDIGAGDGATLTFPVAFPGGIQRLQGLPVEPASVTVTDGTETCTDNGAGAFVCDMGGNGTITYATGDISVTFGAAPLALRRIRVTYNSAPGGTLLPVASPRQPYCMHQPPRTAGDYSDIKNQLTPVDLRSPDPAAPPGSVPRVVPVEDRIVSHLSAFLTGRFLGSDGGPVDLTVNGESAIVVGEMVPVMRVTPPVGGGEPTSGLAGSNILTISLNAVPAPPEVELCRDSTGAPEPVLQVGDTLVLAADISSRSSNNFLYEITDVSRLCTFNEITVDKPLVANAYDTVGLLPGMFVQFEYVYLVRIPAPVEGLNLAELQAVDNDGGVTLQGFAYLRDTQPPAIVIQGVVDGFTTTAAAPAVIFTDSNLCTSGLDCPQGGFSPFNYPLGVGEPPAAGAEALQIRIARLDSHGESPVAIAATSPLAPGDPLNYGWVLFTDNLATPVGGGMPPDPVAVSYDLSDLDTDGNPFIDIIPANASPPGYPQPDPSVALLDPNVNIALYNPGFAQASADPAFLSTPFPGDVSCQDFGLSPPVPCQGTDPMTYRISAQAYDRTGHASNGEVTFTLQITPENRVIAGAIELISDNPALIQLISDNTELRILLLDRLQESGVLYNQNLALVDLLGDISNPSDLAAEMIDSGAREAFAIVIGLLFQDPDGAGPDLAAIATLLDVIRVLIDNGVADDLLPVINNMFILDSHTQSAPGTPGDGTAVFRFLSDLMVQRDRPSTPKQDANMDGRFFRTLAGPLRHLLPMQRELLQFRGSVRRRGVNLDTTVGAGVCPVGPPATFETDIVGLPADNLGFQPVAVPALLAAPVNVQPDDILRVTSGVCNGFETEVDQVIDNATLCVRTAFPPGCGAGQSFEIYHSNGAAMVPVIELLDLLIHNPAEVDAMNPLGDAGVFRALAHQIEDLLCSDPADPACNMTAPPALSAFDGDLDALFNALYQLTDDGNPLTGVEFSEHLIAELALLLTPVSTPNAPLRAESARIETLIPVLDSILAGTRDPSLNRCEPDPGATSPPTPGFAPGLLDLACWPSPALGSAVDFTMNNDVVGARHIDMLQMGLEMNARANPATGERPLAEMLGLLRELFNDPDDSARGCLSAPGLGDPNGTCGADGIPMPPHTNSLYQSTMGLVSSPVVKLLESPSAVDLMDAFSELLNPCDSTLIPGPDDCSTRPDLGRTYNGDLTDFDENFVAVIHRPFDVMPYTAVREPDPLEQNPPLLRAIALMGAQQVDSNLDGTPDSTALRGFGEALRALVTPIGLPGQGENMNPGYPGPIPDNTYVDTPICQESFFNGRTPLEILVPVIDGLLEPLPVGVLGPGETAADLIARTEDIFGRSRLTIILQGLFDDPHVDEPGIPDAVDDCENPCRAGYDDPGLTFVIGDDVSLTNSTAGDDIFLQTTTLEILPELLNTLSRFGFNSSKEYTSIFDSPGCVTGNCPVDARLVPVQGLLIDLGLPLDAPFQIGAGPGLISFDESLTQEAFLQLASFTSGEEAANYVLLLASRIAEDIQPINATTPLPPDVDLAPAALRVIADPDGDGDPLTDGVIDDFLPVARMLAQTGVVRQVLDAMRAFRACGVNASMGNEEIRGGAILHALEDATLSILPALSGAGAPGGAGDLACPLDGGRGNTGGALDTNPLNGLTVIHPISGLPVPQTPSLLGVMQGGSKGQRGSGPGTLVDPQRDFRAIGVGPSAQLCVVIQFSPIIEECSYITAQPAPGPSAEITYSNGDLTGVGIGDGQNIDAFIAANCPGGGDPRTCSYRIRAMREPYNGCRQGAPIEYGPDQMPVTGDENPGLGGQIGSPISNANQSYLDFLLRSLRFLVAEEPGFVLPDPLPVAPVGEGRLVRLLNLLASPVPIPAGGADAPLLLQFAPALEQSLRILLDPARFGPGVESPFERTLRTANAAVVDINDPLTMLPAPGTFPFDRYPSEPILYRSNGPFALDCPGGIACRGNAINDGIDLMLIAVNSVLDQLGEANGQNGLPRDTNLPDNGDVGLAATEAELGYSDDPSVLLDYLGERFEPIIHNLGPGIQILLEAFDTASRDGEFDPLYPMGGEPRAGAYDLAAGMERIAYTGNCRPRDSAVPEENCHAPFAAVTDPLAAPPPLGAFGRVLDGVVDDGPVQITVGTLDRMLDEWLVAPADPVNYPEGVLHRERVMSQLAQLAGLAGVQSTRDLSDIFAFLREILLDEDLAMPQQGRVIDSITPILARFGNRSYAGAGVPASLDAESPYDVLFDLIFTLLEDPTDCDVDSLGGVTGLQRERGTFFNTPEACQVVAAAAGLFPPNVGFGPNAYDAVFRDLGVNEERPLNPLFSPALFDRLLVLFDSDPMQPDLIEQQLPFAGNMALGLVEDANTCAPSGVTICTPRVLLDPPDRMLMTYDPNTILADALIADIQYLIPDDAANCPPPSSPPFLPPLFPTFASRPYSALCDPLVTDDLNRDGVMDMGAAGMNLLGTLARGGNGIFSTAAMFNEQDNDPDGVGVPVDLGPGVPGDIGFTMVDRAVTLGGVDGLDEAFLDGIADLLAADDPLYVVDHENEGPAPVRNRYTVRGPAVGVSPELVDLLDALGELLLQTQLSGP